MLPEMARVPGTVALTLIALVAFAWNSIFTRMALAGGLIDGPGFVVVRLGAGALVLAGLVRVQSGGWSALGQPRAGSVLALFGYAVPFTLAYLRIGAALGALVLFGTVQLTMIGWGIGKGERPPPRTWAGLFLAAGGLGALMLPAAQRPDPLGFVFMVLAGICWGAYSLQGKGVPDPLAANARAFLWSTALALLLAAFTMKPAAATLRGLLLALASGAITSALGYAIWYRALRGLTATQAAIVQLSVPVIAALTAAGLLGETMTLRLSLAGAAVLAGVALAMSARPRAKAPS
jgi:drug/metabolite transporter (DMT)-like permease